MRLTEREREMLRLLGDTPGRDVPREALAGVGGNAQERTVDVQVNRLRRKIERDPANPLHLQTARGAGYRLVTAPSIPMRWPAAAALASSTADRVWTR